MKYLEQRVEELELEVKLLKAKNKLNDTSGYLNNYPPYNDPNKEDYMYNHLDMSLLSGVNIDSSDLPQCYPPYPDIIGSYDNFDWNTSKDWASFNQTDEIPPYPGHEEISEISLEKLNKIEKTIEKDFGKIISKFKMLTHEWEMDGYGYIVSDLEYNKNAIVTNHGKPMVVNKSYLNDIISGYRERIQDTQRALFLLNE
jgi:hypothetical protein